jgi:hypothetical protein
MNRVETPQFTKSRREIGGQGGTRNVIVAMVELKIDFLSPTIQISAFMIHEGIFWLCQILSAARRAVPILAFLCCFLMN